MQWRPIVTGLAVCVLAAPSSAWAILIETGPNNMRVGGYFVRDDGKILGIRVGHPDAKVTEFDRSKVKVKIVHELNKDRLGKLTKDDPKGYHTYAEFLGSQLGDPEARDMAMRLYLIAAHLNTPEYGHKSLVAMSKLAPPAEARKCLAMAYLLDPKGDLSILKQESKGAQPPKSQSTAIADFQKALHYYRTGNVTNARIYAGRDGVDKVFSAVPGMMDYKAFLSACTDINCTACGSNKVKGRIACNNCNGKGVIQGVFGGVDRCSTCNGLRTLSCSTCDGSGVNLNFPDDTLRAVLRAELWAIDQTSGSDGSAKKGTGDTKWSTILQSRQVSPVPPLSLLTITEFDPTKCVYKNGTWVAP